MKIDELISITNAKVLFSGDLEQDVRISTDTRTIQFGDFYLPLKGAKFDGEEYIKEALDKGAIGAFCTKTHPELKEKPLLLQVPDTLEAYLKLANHKRKEKDYTVIAITGSSGKTTTKELVAATLGSKYKVYKTQLNHNNEIGLCQTIFSAPDDTEVLVLEMGMRGLGEIELLSKFAEPDYTIVSNVGTAHIGRLGSKENIAQAKCEIVKYQRGNVFIAHNDELIKKTVQFQGEKIFYSINDVKILEKDTNYSKFEYKNNTYELNVGGDYNIENSLSAINCALKLGLSIEEIQDGLKTYKPIEKRWEGVDVAGYHVINDSYNANPESMRAFVDTIFELYKDYIIVLGDMGELGEEEVKYHSELGKYINKHPLLSPNAKILSIGNLSENITDEIDKCFSLHFNDIDDLVDYLLEDKDKTSKLFLKASRSMKLEQIIDFLGENYQF